MKKHVLRLDEVQLEPGSVIDTTGRVFYWNDRVFREVQSDDAWSVYRSLLSSDFSCALFNRGLVETWIPDDVRLDESIGLLEHKKIDYVTCRSEWTLRMLWDGARRYVSCAALLSQQNLVFKDCHPWNLLFDFCKPVVVDFGSIIHRASASAWLEELRLYFILPLWMHKVGRGVGHAVAREMMHEHIRGVATTLARMRYARYFPPRFHRLSRQYQHAIRSNDSSRLASFFAHLQEYVDGLEPEPPKQYWASYQQGDEVPTPGQKEKQDRVLEVLKSLNPDSVLDMGANKGWYAFAVEELGCKVIAFDNEEYCVDQMYLKGQAENRRVLPLHMDFLHPTPQFGVALAFRTSFDRLRCDVSLVLGLVHHLALRQGLTFDTIAQTVDYYTRTAAIFEFVAPEDEHIANWSIPSYYTKDNLVTAMDRRGFRLECEKHLTMARSLLVFARKP